MPKIVQHPEILVQARRGGTVESLHRACAALAGAGRRDRRALGRPGHGHLLALVRQAAAGAGVARRRHRRPLRLGRRGARHHERLARGPGLPGRTSCAACWRDLGLTEAGPALRRARSRRGTTAPATTPGSSPPACTTAGTSPPTSSRTIPASRRRSRRSRRSPAWTRRGSPPASTAAASSATRRPSRSPRRTFALLPELLPEISAAMRAHPELVEGPGWHRHRGHARASPAPPASAAPRASAASRCRTGAASPSRSSTAPTAPTSRPASPSSRRSLGAGRDERRAAPASPGRRSRTTPATWSASCSPSSRTDAGAALRTRRRASDRRALRRRTCGGAGRLGAPPRRVRLSTAEAAPRSALFGLRLAPQEQQHDARRPRRPRPRRR